MTRFRHFLIMGILALIGATTTATAQTTAVTLNVTDADAQTWNNGTWAASLTPASGITGPFFVAGTATPVPNQIQSGSLNGSGSAAITLNSNNQISPAGTTWALTVCPNATSPCFTQNTTIVGATQTVNLTPPAIRITLTGIPFRVLAYLDTEIVNPALGAFYYNVTSLNQHTWNGTTWITSVGSGTVTNTLGALTLNLPVFGNGGSDVKVGTRTGNTTQVATWNGATTAARCVDTDASGNLQITALDCASSSGTVNPGTQGYTYGAADNTATATPYPLALITNTFTGSDRCAAIKTAFNSNTNSVKGNPINATGEIAHSITCNSNPFPVSSAFIVGGSSNTTGATGTDSNSGGEIFGPSGRFLVVYPLQMAANQVTFIGSGPSNNQDGPTLFQAQTGLDSALGVGAAYCPAVLTFGNCGGNVNNVGPFGTSMQNFGISLTDGVSNGGTTHSEIGVYYGGGQELTHLFHFKVQDSPIANVDACEASNTCANGAWIDDFETLRTTINACPIQTTQATISALGLTTLSVNNETLGLVVATYSNSPTVAPLPGMDTCLGATCVNATGVDNAAGSSGANFNSPHGDYEVGAVTVGAATTITAASITSNVLTVTTANSYTAGMFIALNGMGETFLNGQTVTITTATGTNFTAAFTHANFSNGSDTGAAIQWVGIDSRIIAPPFTAAKQFAYVINNSTAQTSTGGGTASFSPVSYRLNTERHIRGVGHATLVNASCLDGSNNPTMDTIAHLSGSGGGEMIDLHGEEGAIGLCIGCQAPTNNFKVQHTDFASRVTTSIVISDNFGTPTSIDISDVTASHGSTNPTNILIDYANGNTLTYTHNNQLGFYRLDSFGTPWTNANCVDMTNGWCMSNNVWEYLVAGVVKFKVDAAGNITGNGSLLSATGHQVTVPLACSDTSISSSIYTCSTTPSFTPGTGDVVLFFNVNQNNSGAATLNVNGLGNKPIRKWQRSTALAAGDLAANASVWMVYDGTNWEMTTPGAGVTSVFGRAGVVTAQSGDYTLDLINGLAASKTLTNGNNTWTNNFTLTGSSNGVVFGESSAGTTTGSLVFVSTLSNSTTLPLTISQGSMTTAANPGTNAPKAGYFVGGTGGPALSGNNIGGAGGYVLYDFQAEGAISGTPFTTGASRSLYYTQTGGNLRIFAPTNWPNAGTGGYTQGSAFAYPGLVLTDPIASTASVHSSMPPIMFNGSYYNNGAVATFTASGFTTANNYANGDLILLTGATCPQQPVWQVTNATSGTVTLYFPPDTQSPNYPAGIPMAGAACSTVGATATTTNGAGAGGTIAINTIGGPTLFRTKILNFPCQITSQPIYAIAAGNDSNCTQITSDPSAGNTNGLQQWLGVGNVGGGVWIQGVAGGGSVNFIQGSGSVTANGFIQFMGVGSVGEPVLQFGKQGTTLGTTYISGGFSTDADASTTAGALTGVFVSSLINGSGGTIADGVPLKMSATANQVTPTITTDTGAGIVIGVNIGSCATGVVPCSVGFAGFLRNAMVLGTGTCAIGNWVIVDTTTNGRIKCAAAYPGAGTVIGIATNAQVTVGNTVNVLIGLK